MDYMDILEFVKEYEKNTTDVQKNKYLKENLKIEKYIPFLRKDTLAQQLVYGCMYKYEDYIKDDGSIGTRRTDIIKVNSTAQYLMFCRTIIESYTNLKAENRGFYEEYDALKQSGLLDKLMGENDEEPLIPEDEIAEFRRLVDMKQKDALMNYTTPQNYIGIQVERISNILTPLIKPVLDKISNQLEDMSDEEVEKVRKRVDRIFSVIK